MDVFLFSPVSTISVLAGVLSAEPPVRHHVSTDEAGYDDADDSGKVVLLLGKIETSLILGGFHG